MQKSACIRENQKSQGLLLIMSVLLSQAGGLIIWYRRKSDDMRCGGRVSQGMCTGDGCISLTFHRNMERLSFSTCFTSLRTVTSRWMTLNKLKLNVDDIQMI